MELFFILAIIFSFAFALLSPNKNKRKFKDRTPWNNPQFPSPPIPEKTWDEKKYTFEKKDQLSIALKSKFTKQRIINKTEEEVYRLILRFLITNNLKQYKVTMQTSMGEILKCESEGYGTINCKRADFCIVDKDFYPIAIIEVNGSGHYQGDALEREEIKRSAAECAGITYISIRENEDKYQKIENELKKILLNKINLEIIEPNNAD